MCYASLTAQMVKNMPVTQDTRVQSLDWEDLLEKGMASHSSILAWRILWTEEPGGLQSRGSQSDTTNTFTIRGNHTIQWYFSGISLFLSDVFHSA